MVQPRPWPWLRRIAVIRVIKRFVESWYRVSKLFRYTMILFSIMLLGIVVLDWCSKVRLEGVRGLHSIIMMARLRLGFVLFILTEALFFFSFFWAFVSNRWAPELQLGYLWPPRGFVDIEIDPFGVPVLNTMILLRSGAVVTASHHAILAGRRQGPIFILISGLLGVVFILLQSWEYRRAGFSIKRGVYGSRFFMLTGLHGFHVTVGAILLFTCFLRSLASVYSKYRHVGYEMAVWYWHFVDVVWIFLFCIVYWYK